MASTAVGFNTVQPCIGLQNENRSVRRRVSQFRLRAPRLCRSRRLGLAREHNRNKRISRQSYAMHTWSHTWIYKSKDAERTIDALLFLHDMMHGKVSLEVGQYGFRSRHQRWQPKIIHRRHTKKYIRARKESSPLGGIGKECDVDRLAFCKSVVPGLGRTRRCLLEHAAELTVACCKWLANSKQGKLGACSKRREQV